MSFIFLKERAETHPPAQTRGEVVKDEVGEGLGHGANVWDIMFHYNIVQSEVGRRSKGKVAHDQTV